MGIISIFAVRALLGDSAVAAVAFTVTLLVLMFIAFYTIEIDELVEERQLPAGAKQRRRGVLLLLAAPAVAERVYVAFAPSAPLYRLTAISSLLFFCFITWSQLRSIMKQRDVTSETIAMSISVYLLLGLSWGLLYIVMYQIQPLSFSFAAAPGLTSSLAENERHVFSIFVYFSLTTLSTLGYGDILPVTSPARYAAVAEGITGQFYLAILVARLVGLYMARSLNQPAREEPRTPAPKS